MFLPDLADRITAGLLKANEGQVLAVTRYLVTGPNLSCGGRFCGWRRSNRRQRDGLGCGGESGFFIMEV